MFGKPKSPSVHICREIDTTPYFWCNEAILLEVKNGRGALKWIHRDFDDDYKSLTALMLNDKPIQFANLPGCPTSEGLLATGYGIENINCPELRDCTNKINSSYGGIRQAVSVVSPILGLLQDGMYVLADCNAFPTDGNDNFFWDVPNELTLNPATASYLMNMEDECGYVSGVPVFLYPSQGTGVFDPDRVEYYQSLLLSDKRHFPRAIAYHSQEFYSVLLDGHHKAAACALNDETVPTLVIISCTGIGYKQNMIKKMIENNVSFSDIELPLSFFTGKQMQAVRNTVSPWRQNEDFHFSRYSLINMHWDMKYLRAVVGYPNVKELSEEILLEITQITDADIEKWLSDATGINALKLKSAIRYYLRRDKQKSLDLALRCARLNSDPELMKMSFQALVLFKDNEEIEQIFVDWLINDNDRQSILRKIADNYWRK